MILERVIQVVTIGGITALVTGCSSRRSRDQRVGEITFNLDKDGVGAVPYNVAILGAEVVLAHSCLSGTITERGNIHALTEESYGKALVKKITVRTQESKLQNVRVHAIWQDVLAGAVVTELIADFGPIIGISAGSIVDSGAKVAEVTGRYDTFFDLMEQISSQTGLAWNVVNNQLNLYMPEDVYGPPIDAGNFEDGSCAINQSLENVFNYARMQAYEYEYIEIFGEACSIYAKLPIAGPGWELSGDVVESPLFFPEKFKIDFATLEASWDSPAYPFYAKFYARRLIWVTRKDDASIAIYGRREAAPLYHDGGISRANAVLVLDYFLLTKSLPFASINGIAPANFGHKPDTYAELSIPDRGIVQDVYISSVDRTLDQRDLIVKIDVSTRSGVGRDHDPALEMCRRIERLERIGMHPEVHAGQPVSHPIITPPVGQTAVKNGDIILLSGEGTPERSKDSVTVRDINNDIVPGSNVSNADYDPDTGEISGSFIMGTISVGFVRIEFILVNAAGASYADGSRSNPLDVVNLVPSGESIVINGGDPSTSDPVLHLTLSVVDGDEMYIDGELADGINVRNWIPYTASQNVTIAAGHSGMTYVSVKYRESRAHNESTQVQSSINYIP